MSPPTRAYRFAEWRTVQVLHELAPSTLWGPRLAACPACIGGTRCGWCRGTVQLPGSNFVAQGSVPPNCWHCNGGPPRDQCPICAGRGLVEVRR